MNKTSNKILEAALRLMEEKGYQSVSIKEIAEHAQVSEMTVFRHFKNKLGLFESALEKYSYIPHFEKSFTTDIVWDLQTDLTHIAEAYLHLMNQNKSIFLIAIQERNHFPELHETITKHTLKLKKLIVSYFKSMQERNQMKETDVEAQAIIFLTTLFGFFSSTALWESHFLHEWKESFLINTIELFCDSLKQ